jgi:tetratricopeptide (TPR) repeat protein
VKHKTSNTPEDALVEARRLFDGGSYEAALELYESVLAAFPSDEEANYYVATLFNWSGDRHNAITHLERAGLGPGADADFLSFQDYERFRTGFAADQRRAIEGGSGKVLLTALPKSASVFLYVSLASLLQVPVCRVSLGTFPDMAIVPSWLKQFNLGGAVTHDHFFPTPYNLEQLQRTGIDQVLVHVRDPRQALLSYVHMETQRLTGSHDASRDDKAHIAAYLSLTMTEKIDHAIEVLFPRFLSWISDWAAVAEQDAPLRVVMSSYEDFMANKSGYLDWLIGTLGQPIRTDLPITEVLNIIESTEGATNFRKGMTDEWREVFTLAQRNSTWKALRGPLADRFGWSE